MKCLACDFEYEEDFDSINKVLCLAWAHIYRIGKKLPNKEQFEVMQKEGFLPTHGEEGDRKWELYYGHYGWSVDYNWFEISRRIMEEIRTKFAS